MLFRNKSYFKITFMLLDEPERVYAIRADNATEAVEMAHKAAVSEGRRVLCCKYIEDFYVTGEPSNGFNVSR